jgi:hypothetical protein
MNIEGTVLWFCPVAGIVAFGLLAVMGYFG